MTEANKPAYPKADSFCDGLTKRELIAAMAMQGLVSSITMGRSDVMNFICETSVQYADALIAELERTK